MTTLALAHDLQGPAGGPLLVLLHGLTDSRVSYGPTVAHLVERGCRVANVDLRGHGASPRAERYRAIDFAADVAALIDALRCGPALVVGHSLGGLSAAALAAQHPGAVRAVLLEDPPLFEGDDTIRNASPAAAHFPAFAALLRELQGRGATEDEVIAVIGRGPSPYGGSQADRLDRTRLAQRARSVLAVDPATIDAAIAGETWAGYDPHAPLDRPVTVLAADPGFGAVFLPEHAAWFCAANPDAEVRPVAGIGHSIHADPEGLPIYLTELDQFLVTHG